MNNRSKILFFIFFINVSLVGAQDLALFVDASHALGNPDLEGGPFSGFIDINGDYRDDIIRFDRATELYVDIQSNNGTRFTTQKIADIQSGTWALLAGDLNNDGVNEIMSAGLYNGAKIYSAINKQSEFELTQLTEADFFAQNSNFVDINNDGWLDLFICDDDGLSEIYFNDGTGQVYKNNSYIDMTTTPASDNSGNYSSVWTDVDDDGDLDLYIGKCRLGVLSATDPRRVNALFINDNGRFTEAAEDFGIDVGEQSWTANFGDIDNDGDQDLFIINHDARSMLFENINNKMFQEIPLFENGEELDTEGYQSAFADFNNDGYLDILVAGIEDYLLLNNGKKSFVVNETPFGFKDIASFSLGDSNQDGFIDVFAEFRTISSSENTESKLFRSIQNGNHFVTFGLKGGISNRNGLGAKLMLYGAWGKQTRIIKSGTGYGTTNSLTARFGIDDQTEIDSLVVQWPSGIKEVFSNISHDKHYLITEDKCIEELINISSDGTLIDCNIESVELNVINNDNYNIEWSTGDENVTNLSVTSFDHIQAKLISPDDCVLYSQFIVVDTLDALIAPILNLEDEITMCEDAFPVVLENTQSENLIWQNGSIDNDFLIEESGVYFARNFNDCDTISSTHLTVNKLSTSTVAKDSTIIIKDPTILTLDNSQPKTNWYSDKNGNNIIGNGNILTTDIIEKDTSFYFDFVIPQRPPLYKGGQQLDLNNIQNFPFFEEIGGSMTFMVKNESIIEKISVHTETEGNRIIEIMSLDDNTLAYQDTFDIALGYNTLDLNAELEPGTYEIRTNIDYNFQTYQTNSPLLKVTFEGTKFPYRIDNLIDIESCSFGGPFYAYFYNWEVSPKINECTSDIFEFKIDFDLSNGLQVLDDEKIEIYPNPFSEELEIKTSYLPKVINIYNTAGQKVYSTNKINQSALKISPQIEAGVYIIDVLTDTGIYNKIIIAN